MSPITSTNRQKLITQKDLVEFAEGLVLRQPDLNLFRGGPADRYPLLPRIIQQHLVKLWTDRKLLLPNLRAFNSESIGVFSDYSGEGDGNYFIYSFLVCAFNCRELFHREMRIIRQTSGLGDKELAFKDLRMGSMRKVLPQYLAELEKYVPGLLFTLIIDKRLKSVFGSTDGKEKKELASIIDNLGFGTWMPREAEKLMRIIHTSALLAGLLGHEGQKLFWMTDHDNICPNPETFKRVLALFQNVTPLYAEHPFPLIGGAMPFEERSVDFLDILSAADLTAGALQHYLTRRDTMPAEDLTVREGAEVILKWLGHQGLGLKKITMMLAPGENDTVRSGAVEIVPEAFPQEAAFIPIQI